MIDGLPPARLLLIALVACAAPRPPSENGASTSHGPLASVHQTHEHRCQRFVALDHLAPLHELHAPVACGAPHIESYDIEIAPDGHVAAVDASMTQIPNWRAVREIKAWSFEPTLVDGIPIVVCTSISRHNSLTAHRAEICPAT